MRILFVHQNFPGQYVHLAPALARRGHEVVALTKREGLAMPGVRSVQYSFEFTPGPGTHPLLHSVDKALAYGEAAVRAATETKKAGFTPDVICAHPGWGETLFLKDLWPKARQIHYCEFHFRSYGPAQIFDPQGAISLDKLFNTRARSSISLSALDAMDIGVTPTHWQHSQFPSPYRERITVQHDGINTALCRPRADAAVTLPGGRVLTAADRVVTYVARNLEPTRGFPQFMRAMERLLTRRPDVEVLVIGGDETSYGEAHPSGRTWRQAMLDEVLIDPARIHFLGKMRYDHYLQALQISAAHVYMTQPFVLSWSVLEAMSAGCLVVASDTEPVREVIEDGHNGLLVDYFDCEALVSRIEAALREPRVYDEIRTGARTTVEERYCLARCLPVHIRLVESLAPHSAAA
jgi:glycosyltransferase involved in cell wall biosynthesis